MKYIDAIGGALWAFVIFILAVLFIPIFRPITNIDVILTIATFLFAILSGFFISRLGSRYDQIRTLVSSEDAYFLSLYKNAQIYGGEFAKKIGDLIDQYYIASFDIALTNYGYKHNSKYYLQMWDELAVIKKYRSESAYQNLADTLTSIEEFRNTAATVSKEKLGTGHWAILFLLTAIILFSIFCLRTDAFYFQVITVLFSTVLILVLLIIRDLQNLMLGGQALLEESGQEIFELIGKPRYYNKYFLDKGRNSVPKFVKEYRLGLHQPGNQKLEIKLVKNE